MITRIRRVQVGAEYYVPAIKCNVLVSEVLGYDYCFNGFGTQDIIKVNEQLFKELGYDFRTLYFQAQVLITRSYRLKRNRQYEKGDIEMLEWSDLQDVEPAKK